MARRSQFTPAQKRDAVLAVLSKRKAVAESCRELGISEPTLARSREQAVEGMEQVTRVPYVSDGSCLNWRTSCNEAALTA